MVANQVLYKTLTLHLGGSGYFIRDFGGNASSVVDVMVTNWVDNPHISRASKPLFATIKSRMTTQI